MVMNPNLKDTNARVCPKCRNPIYNPLPDVPEWKDKPDSEGWWWVMPLQSGFFEPVRPIYYGEQTHLTNLPNSYQNGKWLKATIPPLPEESNVLP